MNIGFLGLGKLGLPIALAIESKGHDVYGWDMSTAVQTAVLGRQCPHREGGVDELLDRSRLSLCSPAEVVEASDIVFIAVQTPHDPDLGGATRLPAYRRDFDYSHLTTAVDSVARAAAAQRKYLTLAVISTVLPGTMDREVKPRLSADVDLVYNPSFTAMGTTIRDFLDPEFVLIGADDWASNPGIEDAGVGHFYRTIHNKPLFTTDLRTAELIKVAYNTFIGQKIVFANAMMELCHKVGANADDLALALGLATDRIVSPNYLRGGMGDGGPCHPRDNIALSWLSRELGISHDIFSDLMQAREDQTQWLADLIIERSHAFPIVILGKSFKPESHLTEGSPALLLASMLRERGIAFRHHDLHVDGAAPPLEQQPPSLFFVATSHAEYREVKFPRGSVVLDPWGHIADQEEVTVVRIGRP